MATSTTDVAELNRIDRAILHMLAEGRATQGYLIDATPHTRSQIQRRLEALHMGEYIAKVHDGTALYEISDKGRNEVDDFSD
jgi:DNA-binding PadR family transcriptional regulator